MTKMNPNNNPKYKKKNWLERRHNALHKLSNITHELANYSRSFHNIGNVTMANILAGISNEISEIEKEIRDAIGENINESIKINGEHSKTILKATLAGIKLVEEDKKYDKEIKKKKT